MLTGAACQHMLTFQLPGRAGALVSFTAGKPLALRTGVLQRPPQRGHGGRTVSSITSPPSGRAHPARTMA